MWMAATLALAAAVAAPAEAQYFGQNKVQYKTFDFQVLRTEHFDIYYYPQERAGVELASRLAERWHARLGRLMQHTLSGRQPLILYASPSDFQQTNVIGGALGEGTGGVTESARRRIVLPFAGTLADTDHVIGHELVHAYQYDIGRSRARGNRRVAGVERLPLWFIEGMAEYLSIGERSPLTAMWVRDAVLREKLPRIRDLDDPRYFPYRWGHSLWAYVGGRWGDKAVADVLASAIDSGNPDAAFQAILGVKEEELSAAWQTALRQSVQASGTGATGAGAYGVPLTPAGDIGSGVNVAPVLSPDGRRLAYLSSRGLFSIDVYIADAATGEVQRRLTSTDVDPHFESLQFIASAGTWDPQGTRLAVAAVASGRPVIAIYDVEGGDRQRELPLGDLDGALNPAWSPDGRRIAFVGMAGGLSDLYTVDLESGGIERLTDDAFAELHPAWSPDGTRLAVATDRFTTDLATLATGPLRLGVLDVASRTMRAVPGFDRGQAISPQWAADGRSLYTVANPGGISNVYRVAVEGGELRQVTAVATGVSGITETSPALSVAGGRLAFSVFEAGDYRLYAGDDPQVLDGTPPVSRSTDAALLPPRTEQPRATAQLLADAATGLPPPGAPADEEPNRPGLHLDYVAQPTVAIGADRFGGFGAGGIALFMSDMLGEHNLGIAFQATTSIDEDFSASDIGGAVMYQNLRHRVNWGVQVDQTPFRSGFISQAAAIVDGRPTLVEQRVLFRQADRGINGVAAYPLSRAQRIEGGVAYRNLHFDQVVRTTGFDVETGDVVFDERQELPTLEPLNLAQASAALVYDTSSFGATSPVLGQRYRLEVSPTFGSLQYTGVLADYRRYVMPARLYTVAMRALHYGRYGGDSEDPRLSPLFLGYPSLVRGYDVGTFESSDCPPTADGSCEAFDRLVGSRVLVANAELRFPLLRPFGLREGVYGPVPVEVALFADGGLAWTRDDQPAFAGGSRTPVSSAGVALRVNALGFAILQVDASRPFQRPGRGWVFQFSMLPGF